VTHPSIELFLAGLVFGAGFHIAGGVVSFVADLLGRSGL
jgi:succinate dehydrogenase/fumarate reductase cytochrome b subunit